MLLGRKKSLSIFFFAFWAIFAIDSYGLDSSNALYARVLQKYVKNGQVDYSNLKVDPLDLSAYLDQAASLSEKEFQQWNKKKQLAFLINVYNAQTIHLIISHYPVQSIKDINAGSKGPWEMPVVRLFGKMMTLNDLENDWIRKNYSEPRIHFALVCAAKGCPPLLDVPYDADRLEEQLEAQTRKFLSTPDKNSADKVKKMFRLSPIFNWYEADFVKAAGSVAGFVRPYFSLADSAGSDYQIQYTYYDWSLNASS